MHLYSYFLKKISIAAMITTVVFTPQITAGAQYQYVSQINQTEVLTLEQAIEKAFQSNIDLEIHKLDVNSEKMRVIMAFNTYRKIDPESVTKVAQALNKYEPLAKAEKEMQYKIFALKAMENRVRLETTKSYYEAYNAQAVMELKQDELKKGSSEEREKAVTDAQNNHQKALAKLNEWIGESEEQEWRLKEVPNANSFVLPTLEEALDTANLERVEILRKQEDLKLEELKAKLYENYSSLGTYRGRIVSNDVKKMKLEMTKIKLSIDKDVKANYQKMESVIAKEKEQKLALLAAEENYQQVVERFQNGQAELQERTEAEELLTECKSKYQATIHEYNMTLAAFTFSLGK